MANKLSVADILESLKTMSLLEVKELIEAIEKEFNVSAAVPVAVAGAAGGDDSKQAASEVSVILKDVGANKVNVIKVVREITGLGLMEAKKLVDNAPSTIKEEVKVEDANKMKEQFAAAGATVEFK